MLLICLACRKSLEVFDDANTLHLCPVCTAELVTETQPKKTDERTAGRRNLKNPPRARAVLRRRSGWLLAGVFVLLLLSGMSYLALRNPKPQAGEPPPAALRPKFEEGSISKSSSEFVAPGDWIWRFDTRSPDARELPAAGKPRSVSIRGFMAFTTFTDADLREFPRQTESFGLNLWQASVTPAGLRALAAHENLRILIPHKLTDESLKILRELNLLHSLKQAYPEGPVRAWHTKPEDVVTFDVGDTEATGIGLQELAGLPNLATLSFDGGGVEEDELRALVALKQLTTLHLIDHTVQDRTLTVLREIGLLSALVVKHGSSRNRARNAQGPNGFDLSYTFVTDVGLKELAVLPKLASLDLSGTQVTDAGLKELAALNDLTALDLRGTKVTNRGIRELQKVLPRCKIEADA